MEENVRVKFRVVGVVITPEFQKCRTYVEAIRKAFPRNYRVPDIRPMLDVYWEEFIIKERRKVGGEIYQLRKQVAVYMNGEFLGDDEDLAKYIAKKYKLSISKNFHQLGREHLIEEILRISDKGRTFVYLTIAVNNKEIGSLLFQLYDDLVPWTCAHFIKRCKKKHNGFLNSPIRRLVKPSWIQFGDRNITHHRQPCENYIVSHDRRGVLSMCHNGKHCENSTQFHISLEPTPWMDYYYVAFGQLIQGAEVLKYLEQIPCYHQQLLKDIRIVACNEYTLCPTPDPKDIENLKNFLLKISEETGLHPGVIDIRDTDSVLYRKRYGKGLYCFATDLRSHLPFLHLPDYLLDYLIEKKPTEIVIPEPQEEEFADDYDLIDYFDEDALQRLRDSNMRFFKALLYRELEKYIGPTKDSEYHGSAASVKSVGSQQSKTRKSTNSVDSTLIEQIDFIDENFSGSFKME